MGPEEEVALKLALKNRRETAAGVHEVGDELDRTGDKAKRVGREARVGAAGMVTLGKSGKVAGRAVLYGTGAAAAGVVGLGIVVGKFTKDSVKGWEDHTKVVRQTRAVIKSTGGAANLTARQVGGLSDALERKTGVDGDVIQSAGNMLLTFKNVRNEQGKGNKIFSRSLSVLNDMSVAMKSDASKSAIQLGKALNDPVKGVSALAKVGVTFTDGQKDQIANYVEQNKMAKAQKIILGELTSEFGGSAKAQMTLGDQVNVGYHQLQDTVGKAVLPLQQKFQRFLIDDAIPAAQDYADVFEKRGVPMIEKYAGIFEKRGIPAIKNFYDEAKPVAESILPAIGDGLETTADAVKVIAPRMKAMFDGFNGLPDWAKEAIIIGAGGAAVGKKLGAFNLLGKSGGLGGSLATFAKPLPVIVTNPGFNRKNGTPVVTPSADDRRTPSKRKRDGGVPLIPIPNVLALLYPALTGSQAPGQQKDSGKTVRDFYDPSFAAAPSSVRLGKGGLDGFDARLSRMKDPTAQAAAIKNLAGYLVPKPANGVTVDKVIANLNDLLPKTRSTVGMTTTELVRNSKAQADVNRLTASGAKRGDEYALSMSGLGDALTDVGAKHVRPSVTIDGLDPALDKVNTLRTNLLGLPAIGSYGNGLGVRLPTTPSQPRKPRKHRARGGRLGAGETAVVGEDRPELWIPDRPGTVMPQVPSVADVVNLMGDDDEDSSAGPARSTTLVIPLEVDGREISRVTVDDIEERLSYR